VFINSRINTKRIVKIRITVSIAENERAKAKNKATIAAMECILKFGSFLNASLIPLIANSKLPITLYFLLI